MEKVVVAQITRVERSGPNNVMIPLCIGYLEQGWKVVVASHQGQLDDPELVEKLIQAGAVYSPLAEDASLFGVWKSIIGLLRIKHQHPNSIWHTHCLRSLVLSVLVGFRWIVNTSHNVPLEDWPLAKGAFWGNVVGRLNLIFMRRANKVVSISPYMQDKLFDHKIQSYVINNPVFSSRFIPRQRKIRRGEREILNLLCIGRFISRKNQKAIFDALANLGRDAKAIKLTVLGEGDEERNLLSAASDCSCQVVFAGVTEDPRPYYWEADYVVNASIAEGLPMVVVEALAAGRPVLLSDIGAHRAFEDKESRKFIRYFNFEEGSLPALLRDIMNSSAEPEEQRIRKWAQERFDYRNVTREYLKVFSLLRSEQIASHKGT